MDWIKAAKEIGVPASMALILLYFLLFKLLPDVHQIALYMNDSSHAIVEQRALIEEQLDVSRDNNTTLKLIQRDIEHLARDVFSSQ